MERRMSREWREVEKSACIIPVDHFSEKEVKGTLVASDEF